AQEPYDPEIAGRSEATRLVLGFTDQRRDTKRHAWTWACWARLETRTILRRRILATIGADEIGMAERQPELGGVDRAMNARPEHPQFWTGRSAARHGVNAAIGMSLRQFCLARGIIQKLTQQLNLTRKRIDRPGLWSRLQGARSHLGRAGRTSQSQVDPARIEQLEHAELFGDFERAVMRQHDAARADAQTFGLLR